MRVFVHCLFVVSIIAVSGMPVKARPERAQSAHTIVAIERKDAVEITPPRAIMLVAGVGLVLFGGILRRRLRA
jgi:hypothetical protein